MHAGIDREEADEAAARKAENVRELEKQSALRAELEMSNLNTPQTADSVQSKNR